MDQSTFDRVADELYMLPPAAFTAARDQAADRAKQDGDRALAKRLRALRRPTAAAWAVNLLAHRHAGLVREAAELGSALREAQQQLDGDALRTLTDRRRRLLHRAAEQARQDAADAGLPLGPDMVTAVEQSLTAALADPESAERLAAGRLVHPLDPPAWPAAQLTAVPAVPATPVIPAVPAGEQRETDREQGPGEGGAGAGSRASRVAAERRAGLALARRAAEQAELTAAEASGAAARAERARRLAEEARRSAAGHAERARRALATAREQDARTRAALEQAEQELRDAEAAARTAVHDAEQARFAARHAATELKRLEAGGGEP